MTDKPESNVIGFRPLPPGAEIKNAPANDKRRTCRHASVWIWEGEPIIECRSCGAMLDPVDWMRKQITVLNRQLEEKAAERNRVSAQIEELKRWNPWLRAVKELERIWRSKMLPCCPHCSRGIEAEALVKTGCVSRTYEARR